MAANFPVKITNLRDIWDYNIFVEITLRTVFMCHGVIMIDFAANYISFNLIYNLWYSVQRLMISEPFNMLPLHTSCCSSKGCIKVSFRHI